MEVCYKINGIAHILGIPWQKCQHQLWDYLSEMSQWVSLCMVTLIFSNEHYIFVLRWHIYYIWKAKLWIIFSQQVLNNLIQPNYVFVWMLHALPTACTNTIHNFGFQLSKHLNDLALLQVFKCEIFQTWFKPPMSVSFLCQFWWTS